MPLSTSNRLLESIENLVHQDTQLQTHCLDLTADEVYEINESGSLDFGGSEFEPANTAKIDPVKKNENDSYGWWNLAGGTFIITTNERLGEIENESMIISPHPHAIAAGLMINSFVVHPDMINSPLSIPMIVPGVGVRIKENARIASAYTTES